MFVILCLKWGLYLHKCLVISLLADLVFWRYLHCVKVCKPGPRWSSRVARDWGRVLFIFWRSIAWEQNLDWVISVSILCNLLGVWATSFSILIVVKVKMLPWDKLHFRHKLKILYHSYFLCFLLQCCLWHWGYSNWTQVLCILFQSWEGLWLLRWLWTVSKFFSNIFLNNLLYDCIIFSMACSWPSLRLRESKFCDSTCQNLRVLNWLYIVPRSVLWGIKTLMLSGLLIFLVRHWTI